MSSVSLDQISIRELRGVGPQLCQKLAKLGLKSLQDLIFHLPMRYIDRTKITPIGSLQPQTDVVLEGEIRTSEVVFGRRRSLVCKLQDGTGTTVLRFFHFSRAQQEGLKAGAKLRCFGEVRPGRFGLELYHPEYQHLDGANPPELEDTLTPIYPLTEGISQTRIRDLCSQAIKVLNSQGIPELFPESLKKQFSTVLSYSLVDALQLIHSPPPGFELHRIATGEHPAQQRLAAEELIAHNLSLLKMRQKVQQEKSCKVCHKPFKPFKSTAVVCSYRCAIKYAKRKEKAKKQKVRDNVVKYSKLMAEAKAAFQKWVRKRDEHLPCISCGKMTAEQWDGGHYRKAEIYRGVIFHEWNVNRQCSYCNRYLHGAEVEYR